jgi:hypothetical protein
MTESTQTSGGRRGAEDPLQNAEERGPKGEGPVGVRVPDAGTQEKGVPADEQGAGRRGVEGDTSQPGVSLGELTEEDHQV